jgi:TonB family protein
MNDRLFAPALATLALIAGVTLSCPTAATARVLEKGQLFMPQILRYVPPSYPHDALEDGVEGRVVLAVDVDETGNVAGVFVEVEVPMYPSFAKSSEEAILQWRFKPGLQEGVPVRTTVRVPFEFRLE